MKIAKSWVFIGMLLTGYACRQVPGDAELLKKGAAISEKLVTTLMAELQTEIREKGIPGAINYCSMYAIPITDSISREEQVEISRVSHRFRNPLNAADEKEIGMIEKYIVQQHDGEKLLPQIVTRNGQKIYYGPIVLGSPLCLSCHGPYESLDPDVRKVLSERYPEDHAVDFSLNEIRGLFKVVFD